MNFRGEARFSCHNSNSRAEVRGGGAEHEVATSGGSESLSAANWLDWSAKIGDIRRCRRFQFNDVRSRRLVKAQ